MLLGFSFFYSNTLLSAKIELFEAPRVLPPLYLTMQRDRRPVSARQHHGTAQRKEVAPRGYLNTTQIHISCFYMAIYSMITKSQIPCS